MEKTKNSKKSETKKALLKTTKINKNIQSKNTNLENSKNNITKRKNIIHKTNKSFVLSNVDKGKLLPKQNSNNLTITFNSGCKSNLNKNFLSNSCEKREKKLKYNKTNDIFNKTISINHKKFFSISTDISTNYKKYLNHSKTNQHKHFNSIEYETKNNCNKFNKMKYSIKVNKTIFRNKNINLNNNKLLNRSMELRKKIKKSKLKENSKINLIRNKDNININSDKIKKIKNKRNNKNILQIKK